eukprot:m.1399449 g.1399449  ORF g.1399449 m.1399449 type:complete len:1747 (-) comp25002_c0_seq6:325-5565(-)
MQSMYNSHCTYQLQPSTHPLQPLLSAQCWLAVAVVSVSVLSWSQPTDAQQHDTFFVATDGHTANDCKSMAAPCPDMTTAVRRISEQFSRHGQINVTIEIGNGTYVTDCSEEGLSIVAPNITIRGHSSVPVFDCTIAGGGKFLTLTAASVFVEYVAVKNSFSVNIGPAVHWACGPEYQSCSLWMAHCAFYNNTAKYVHFNTSGGNGVGGAMAIQVTESLVAHTSSAKIQFRNCSFERNSADLAGGGLSISSDAYAEVELIELTCVTNAARGEGGCVAVALHEANTQSSVNISAGVYAHNIADGGGGAVSVSFTNTSNGGFAYIVDGDFVNNTSLGAGGAVAISFYKDVTDTNVSVVDGTYSINNASVSGGAVNVFFNGDTSDTNVSVVDGTYSMNSLGAADDSYGYGGAVSIVYNTNAIQCVTTVMGGVYDHNMNYGEDTRGGAVLVIFQQNASRCSTMVVDGVFTGNRATDGGAVALWYVASVIDCTSVVDKGRYKMNNASFSGGAVQISYSSFLESAASSTVRVTNATFESNVASGGDGGAVMIQTSASGTDNTIECSGTAFSDNEAIGSGGAIAIEVNGLEMFLQQLVRGNTYTNNTAHDKGGAVFVASSFAFSVQINIYNNTFVDNECEVHGDAIASVHAGTSGLWTHVRNCTFVSSSARLTGGAVACTYLSSVSQVKNVFSGCTFTTADGVAPTNTSTTSALLVQYLGTARTADITVDQCTFNVTAHLHGSSRSNQSWWKRPTAIGIRAVQLTDVHISVTRVFISNTLGGYGGGIHMAIGNVPDATTAGQGVPALSRSLGQQASCGVASQQSFATSNVTVEIQRCSISGIDGTALRLMLNSAHATVFHSINVTISECNFTDNGKQGAIMLAVSNLQQCYFTVTQCRLVSNGWMNTTSGGALAMVAANTLGTDSTTYTVCDSQLNISNIHAESNKALFGGALNINAAMLPGLKVFITRFNAAKNTAAMTGGALYADGTYSGKIVVSNSTFLDNSAKIGSALTVQAFETVEVHTCVFDVLDALSNAGTTVMSVRDGLLSFTGNNITFALQENSKGTNILVDGHSLMNGSTYDRNMEFPLLRCIGGYPMYTNSTQRAGRTYFTPVFSNVSLNLTTSNDTSNRDPNKEHSAVAFTAVSTVITRFRYSVECRACGPRAYQLSLSCGDCLTNFTSQACCHQCPEHADCTSVDGLMADAGYWPCPKAECEAEIFACPEGYCVNATSCSEGRKPFKENILCGTCESSRSAVGTECIDCSKRALFDWILLLVSSFALTGAVVFVGAYPTLSATKKSFFYFLQTLYLILGPTSSWAPWMGYFNLSIAKYVCVDVGPEHARLWLQLGSMVLFVVAWLLMLVGDWIKHIVRDRKRHGQWEMEDRHPSLLEHLRSRPLKRYEGLREEALHAESDESDDEATAYAAAQVSEEEPTCSASHLHAETALGAHGPTAVPDDRKRLRTHAHHTHDPVRTTVGLRLCRQFRYLRAMQYILLFSYESLTEQAMQIVNCISVGSCGAVLAAYPAVPCRDNPAYTRLFAVAIVILIYAIVFPVAMGLFLRNYCGCGGGTRTQSESNVVLLAKYGVLYDHFKPTFWWWEVQVLIRRMVVLAVYVSKYSNVAERAYGIFVVSFVILVVHVLSQPYKHTKDNLVETASLSTLVYASVSVAVGDMPGSSTVMMHAIVIATLIAMGIIAFFDVGEHTCNVFFTWSKVRARSTVDCRHTSPPDTTATDMTSVMGLATHADADSSTLSTTA